MGCEEGEVWGQEVGEREDEEGPLGAAEEAVAGVDARVDGELQEDTDDAEDAHREADCRRAEAQAAREVEGEGDGLGFAGRARGGGEEDGPERSEAAHLEVHEGDGGHDEEDIGGEGVVEGWSGTGFGWGGEGESLRGEGGGELMLALFVGCGGGDFFVER